MDELELAEKAGTYLRTFALSQRRNWIELMQGVNPNQGYGTSPEAYKAYEIAIGLSDWCDVHWINCAIPENYASAPDLREMLESSLGLLKGWLLELDQAWESCSKRDLHLETIGLVASAVQKACRGVEEALRQLNGLNTVDPNVDAFNVVYILSRIADRFDKILLRLKNRRVGRAAIVMNDEYDVQYLFESLLALEVDDIRSEEYGPSVAGGSGRADTYLPKYRCCVEFKMTRSTLTEVPLRKQIADDFLLYGADDRYENLFVFIYDPNNHILNPTAFEEQLSKPVTGLKQVIVLVR